MGGPAPCCPFPASSLSVGVADVDTFTRVDSTHADCAFSSNHTLLYVPNLGQVTINGLPISNAVQQSANTIRFTTPGTINVGNAWAFVGAQGWLTPAQPAQSGVLA